MPTENSLDAKTILTNAIILFVGTYLLRMVIAIGYGFIIGFQTRGDNEIITRSVIEFGSSAIFMLILAVIFALISYMRSRQLAGGSTSAFIQIAISIVVALVLFLIMDLLLLGGYSNDSVMRQVISMFSGGLAGGYIGSMQVGRQSPA